MQYQSKSGVISYTNGTIVSRTRRPGKESEKDAKQIRNISKATGPYRTVRPRQASMISKIVENMRSRLLISLQCIKLLDGLYHAVSKC